MKKIIFLYLALLIIAALTISCQKAKNTKKSNEATELQVVVNGDNPQNPDLSLKFEEELSLTKEGWWPSKILVDDEGNIYVSQVKENVIYKFDSQGNEILKKEFPKGQGPGEFVSMAPRLFSDGRLFIYDRRQLRMIIMNGKYEIQNVLKFKEYRWVFQLDSEANMYFWLVKFLPRTKDANRLVLSKFSPSGELVQEIFEHIWSAVYAVKGKSIERKHPLYKPYGMYKLDSRDNIFYALSDKYEINVVSPEGKKLKIVVKKCRSRKITEKDVEKAMSFFPFASKPSSMIIIPEFLPYIADFFILENNYLMVITFENEYDKRTLAGDLFDEKGIFQARVEVPKYYRWFDLMGPGESNAVVKKKHFYTIEADEAEENFYVKRYIMTWE
ncbi:MAG: hypothetical protein JSV96_03790 [Candidatus Aminicenantes bacterium]|nr:MAG: hypothetical protein JSV96_03790 [Candidatus Aminicenantes bacterium]